MHLRLTPFSHFSTPAELQGHAIKNQDLLLASGATSLKGPDVLTAVDEDIEAAVWTPLPFSDLFNLMCSFNPCHVQSRSQLVDQQQLLEPDLRARARELTEIAKSIATLAELFKDLSSLVIDQGTLLDSVEYNIEQTAVHMNESVKELDMATRFVHSRVVITIKV
jgi:syntaxin 16